MKTQNIFLILLLMVGLLGSCTPIAPVTDSTDSTLPAYGTGGEQSAEPDNEKDG